MSTYEYGTRLRQSELQILGPKLLRYGVQSLVLLVMLRFPTLYCVSPPAAKTWPFCSNVAV